MTSQPAITPEPASTIEVMNPATGQVAGRVPLCSAADVKAAIDRARQAQPAWAALPFRQRAVVMIRFHDLILTRSSVCDAIPALPAARQLHAGPGLYQ